MSKLYCVARCYSPNSAGCQRFMSFLNSFEKAQIDIVIVYLTPDENKSKLKIESEHIKVLNMWEKGFINHSLFKYLSYALYVVRFLFMLKDGDSVFTMGFCEILPFLLRKRNIRVYYEVSEHPEVSLSTQRFFRTSIQSLICNLKKVDGLFVITESLKKYFVNCGVEEQKIHIVNMTVNPKRFDNIPKKNDIEPYIAYCGMASNNKDGVDQLIQAFKYVHIEHPSLKLYIIGKTPNNEQFHHNEKLVHDLGLDGKVVFLGPKPATQIPSLLSNARVLALARPNNKQAMYGFPTKVGEYLLTGCPVVVTKVGELPKFLVNRESVVFAEPDNPFDFSKQIIWVLDNPVEARRIGSNGRTVALESFNGDIEGRKIINVIMSHL